MLALTALRADGPGLALGTRQGVVKRVNPEVLGKDEWEVIALKDGDEVVGAVELRTGDEELCFITSDAQLLHFGAAGVRPQGRSGGGIAGIRLARRSARRVVRRARPGDRGRGDRLAARRRRCPAPSRARSRSRRSRSTPRKGRATGGVRCHRFLKGEDALVFAWAGAAPARAAAASGAAGRPARGRPAAATARGVPGSPADRRLRRARCRPSC